MSRHRPDLIICMGLAGTSPGLVCNKCDGKCPLCDSHVNPKREVRLCDECAISTPDRCVICQGPGQETAYFCSECVSLEKDRDGCPNVINLGTSQIDRFYQKNKRPRAQDD